MKIAGLLVVLSLLGAGVFQQDFETFPIGSAPIAYNADNVNVQIVGGFLADVNGPSSFKDRTLTTIDPTCLCAPNKAIHFTISPGVHVFALSMTTSMGTPTVLPKCTCFDDHGGSSVFGLAMEIPGGSWLHTRARAGSCGMIPEEGDTNSPKVNYVVCENGDFDNVRLTTP